VPPAGDHEASPCIAVAPVPRRDFVDRSHDRRLPYQIWYACHDAYHMWHLPQPPVSRASQISSCGHFHAHSGET
jgi:hypothetical protein